MKLISDSDSDKVKNGEFNLLFDVGLSEIDKVLEDVDKIDSVFHFEFPKKYLAFLREKTTYYYNRNELKKLATIEKKFIQRLQYQLALKKSFFKIPIWNEKIADIMAQELIEQILNYRGSDINKLAKGTIKIPIRFRFGLFALHYIYEKNKFLKNDEKALTFN